MKEKKGMYNERNENEGMKECLTLIIGAVSFIHFSFTFLISFISHFSFG